MAREVLDRAGAGGDHPAAVELEVDEAGVGFVEQDVVAEVAAGQGFELEVVVVIGVLEAEGLGAAADCSARMPVIHGLGGSPRISL